MSIRSLHVLGSRQLGGADWFFVRLVCALHRRGEPVFAVTRPRAPVNDQLARCGVEPVILPMANKWDIYSVLGIRRAVRDTGARVVQTYMGRATRLTRVGGIPGTVHLARLGGFYKVRGYYRHADAWVGNTPEVCDYLEGTGLPPERVHYIGNFVDEPMAFDAEQVRGRRHALGIPEHGRMVLALGRFVHKKGFDVLLRGFARVVAQTPGPRPHLVVCGDGPLAAELQALAGDLGIAGAVTWTGWTNQAAEYYALADLFVCPSRHEPLGNVILEAWSYGLPVISTRTSAGRVLVEEGVTGRLCEPGDEASLAGVLGEALKAPPGRLAALGRGGLARVQEEFSEERIVGRYLDLYAELLAWKG